MTTSPFPIGADVTVTEDCDHGCEFYKDDRGVVSSYVDGAVPVCMVDITHSEQRPDRVDSGGWYIPARYLMLTRFIIHEDPF